MISKFRAFHGGVESHIDDVTSGLRAKGHIVDLFSVEDVSDIPSFDAKALGVIDKVKSVGSMFWNMQARRALQAKIDDFGPDILHYHSIYHQLSPSVLSVDNSVSVMTLHDYKLVAPCYSLYRESSICIECVGRTLPLPAIKHKCIKGSTAASSLCAAESVLFKRFYVNSVSEFILPSNYLSEMVSRSGVSLEKLNVVPWGVEGMEALSSSPDELDLPTLGSNVFIYAGRLHPSKGVRELLDAWLSLDGRGPGQLVVAGEGELDSLVAKAADSDNSIVFLGRVDRSYLRHLIRGSKAVIFPSIVPETMGLAALESLTVGTPVISSGAGALADLQGAGVLEVRPDHLTDDLANIFTRIAESPDLLEQERLALLDRNLERYSIDSMVDGIFEVYERALKVYRGGTG